jgi:ribonucleoside-diphosphate reductase alpha chain
LTYSYQEVYDATLEYFKGDTLQTDIFVNKYALRDQEDNYYELTPDDMWARVAKEIVRIDKNYKNSILDEEKVYNILKENYICPGGSILFGAGNPFVNVSLANCYAIPTEDSMSGIFNTAKNLANISKRRGGVGINLSPLRPDGASVKNAAKTSSGAWSWGKFISDAAETVGQQGRRSACLLLLDVSHPDIFKFISMKDNINSVNGANISVAITNKFMEAVEADADWDLVFDGKVYETVKAKDLFSAIATHAAKTGEPGVIYWDTYADGVPLHFYPGLEMICTNPCLSGDTELLIGNELGIGFKKIAINDINIGDMIWSNSGWTKVVGKYNRGIKPVYRYKTYRGYLDATENHKIVSNGEKVEISKAEFIDICDNIEFYPKDESGYKSKKELGKITSSEYIGDSIVWDITVDNNSHTFSANGFVVSNCGELLLGPENSCILLANNLSGFVENKKFDFVKYEQYVRYGTRLLDNIIDLEIEVITNLYNLVSNTDEKELYKRILDRLVGARRIGLGTFGLADALIKMELRYDSDEALALVKTISEIRLMAAYDESYRLGEDRGVFPDYDLQYDNQCSLIKELCAKNRLVAYPRRNGALLTDPPTGSIATMLGVSTGIEPIFDFEYTRKRKINPEENETPDFIDAKGVKFKNYKVKYAPLQQWIEQHPDEEIPDFFVGANHIDWHQRVKLQGLIGTNSDGGCSSTLNLPKGTTADVIQDIYMEAWKQGCKGLTVYVDGSRDGILVRDISDKKEACYVRPKEISCEIFHETVQHHGETIPYVIIIGLKDGKPFEVFGGESANTSLKKSNVNGIIKKYKTAKNGTRYELIADDGSVWSLCEEFNATVFEPTNRQISLSLREGIDVRFIVDQFTKCKKAEMFSYFKVVARVLKRYITEGTHLDGHCPQCGEKAIIYSGGCGVCQNCGHSACG